MISDTFFSLEFTSICRAELEFSFFFTCRKHHDDGRLHRIISTCTLTIGGEIAKILSLLINNSLLTWVGLLDGTRILTLVNLLYLRIMDNHWNYVNFEALETHCN